ncbi:MAG: hypothetical protein ABI780_06175 [Ardenticatenales bacterium]
MTLNEARVEVMSWLDPGHHPRIVSADFVAGAMVAAERNGDRSYVLDQYGGVYEQRWLSEGFPTTLVRIVAETDILEQLVLPQPFEVYGKADKYRSDADGVPRSRLFALFDALSGARVVASRIRDDGIEPMTAMTALAAPTLARPVAVTAMSARPTALRRDSIPTSAPSGVPTPIGSLVDAEHVPPAMHGVLTAYPLLPGSTWTWEVTTWDAYVSWTRSRITEVVLTAWQLDPRHVVARSVTSRKATFGADRIDAQASSAEVWRVIDADGVVAPYPPVSTGEFAHTIGAETYKVAHQLGLPLEPLVNPHLSTDWSWPMTGGSPRRINVTTSAGRFENCGAFEVIGGAAWGSVRAICSGVGYVETDSWVFNSIMAQQSVMQLSAFHVVLPR